MQNILLLTDFSELSTYAKNLADKIGKHTNATLHLLKVINLPSDIATNENGEPVPSSSLDLTGFTQEMQESLTVMDVWAESIESNYTSKVKYGRILNTVNQYITEQNIDLVIMGTHGVTGLKELLSGSITEQVIKKNSIPVLSLKCDRSDIDFSDFLVTGDFGPDRVSHLSTLKALQKVFNSNIHLLTVNTKNDFESSAESMDKMKAFAKANQIENVFYHIHNDQSIEEGIVNFANNYDATHDLKIDIIAVEKKNKSELKEIFTSCDAIDFVNHVFRPILSYRKED